MEGLVMVAPTPEQGTRAPCRRATANLLLPIYDCRINSRSRANVSS